MSDLFKFIKEHVSFESVANEYDIYFKNNKASCPFHPEKTPSFHNYETHGKCFGCDKLADVIELEAYFKGLSPLEAAKSLADRYNININSYDTNPKKFSKDKIKNEKEEKQRESQSDKLIKLVLSNQITLIHDPLKNGYAKVMYEDHFEYYKIKSNEFKLFISSLYWNKYQKSVNQNSITDAIRIFESKAIFEGHEHKLHNRVASDSLGIMYDLGKWKGVLISKEGWKLHDFVPPVFKYGARIEQSYK